MIRRVQPWTTTSSECVVRDRWISVRADHCVTAEGTAVSPYYVLEYPDWVHVVALDGEENVVLVKQYRHALGRISLELPGGAMDVSDENAVAAAARELLEETGFGNAGRMTLVGSHSPNPSSHANLMHTVLAENVVEVQPPLFDDIEILEVERVPYREAVRLAMSGAIMHSMHIASLLLGLSAAKKIGV